MAIAWDVIQKRHDELAQILSASADLDHAKRSAYQKELSQLSQVLTRRRDLLEQEQELARTTADAQTNTDPEMAELFAQEIKELQLRVQEKENNLEEILYPPNELDQRSAYLEIRAGAGGQEAALFAADLQKMYTNYALKRGWKVYIDSLSMTDLKGVREVILHIAGKGVYGDLKKESGVHRVQRVPATETQGRIHTSTATVAVLPEAEDVDLTINPADLRIDVYRAGGAGGQHVNKTESAVRITHIPTGIVVACQEERSQHKNKEKAMKQLKSRMLAAQLEQQHAERSKMRKEQVGGGERAEKVRTYNFPQNRVTDHQVNLTLSKLDRVIEGDLDDIVEALRVHDRQERRKHASIFVS